MNKKLLKMWLRCNSAWRDKARFIAFGTLAVVLITLLYASCHSKKSPPPLPTQNETVVAISPSPDQMYMFEEDIKIQLQNSLAQQRKAFTEELAKLKKELQESKPQSYAPSSDAQAFFSNQGTSNGFPTSPVAPELQNDEHIDLSSIKEQRIVANQDQENNGEQAIEYGICTVNFTDSHQQEREEKKKNRIFLPPSIMPAKLLTGIDALTSQQGEANPEAVIFRVQAPAVLPNSIKRNLKGCFVVAQAHGNLAKERVQVRLQSLNCMGKDGEAVITQRIQGFVTDSDGKKDMAGIVVARSGSNLARSFLAGFAGGLGEVAKSAGSTTQINPLGGIMQTMTAKQALQTGVGEGITSATKELQKFYLDLARQSVPVIEVGPAKDVTLIIQEGVELEVKEHKND